ncbi:MAG TPA: hypothetical protein VFO89_00515, partial [Thermoanaerobaculia bacterium]|nr:hypothetical protein [Thermoanaerobaculia bacterium]
STVPMRPVHSLLGTVGITTLATVPAAIALGNQTFLSIYTLLFAVLVALIAVVAVDHVRLNGQRQKTWPRK